MIPPPLSSNNSPGGNPQTMSNISHQMQDMRLGPPNQQSPGFKSSSNNPDMGMGLSPYNKSPMTSVTYSNQANTTYPYINNNNQVRNEIPSLYNQHQSQVPQMPKTSDQTLDPSMQTNNGVINGYGSKLNQENGIHTQPVGQKSPMQPTPQFSTQNPLMNPQMRPQSSPFPAQTTYTNPSMPLGSGSQLRPPPPNSSVSSDMQMRPPNSSSYISPSIPSGHGSYSDPHFGSLQSGNLQTKLPPSPNYASPNIGSGPNQSLPSPQPGFQRYGTQPSPGGYASTLQPGTQQSGSYPPSPLHSGVQPSSVSPIPSGGYTSPLPPGMQPSVGFNSPSPPSSMPSPYNTAQNLGTVLPPGSQTHFSNIPPRNSNNSWPGQNVPGTAGTGGSYPYGSPSQIAQPQRQLNLDEMPSAVQVREEDKKLHSGPYPTDVKGQQPPLVSSDFTVQDRGICSPRFIRSSLYCLPNNPDILKQTALPFAITINPLASLHEGEVEPPTCLFRNQGPLRCKRCKAYICPFMTFMEGGRCFQCAFCKVVTEVPQDYFCFLDGMGERTDKYHRPELCLGSYEYIATKEYCRKDELPNPPAYIFMIEVSHATFRNGLIPLLSENMKNVLQCLKNDLKNDHSKLRVGFVTYNNVLHFYNMKKNLTQPHIMVLSDVHNAFVPLLEGFLVTLAEAEALVDSLMEHIPRLFMNETATEIILGPVIQVGLEALKNANCSGKLLVFHSTIPNANAPGKLPHREGQKLLGTEKQKIALSPQTDFYTKLAQDCVAAGCAVDLFLFPNAYVDVASLSPLIRHTGGQMYKYTYFQSHVDGDKFLDDLEQNITTPTAFDAVLRVRTSAGISPVFYYGNFFMSNATDVELSCVDNHKAVTVELAYDDKLPENETVYIQSALLYTTCAGERRIRVHNLALPTCVGMPDVYKCAEMDAIVNFLAKQALKQLFDHTPQQISNGLFNRSAKILTCYRKHCAANSVSGQLILPDSLKLLPIYTNCLLRSDAIGGGADMALDDRCFALISVNSMSIKSTSIYFYPNLIPLHEMDPNSADVPNPIRCSIEKMSNNGAYLLENGIHMFLWIGQAINLDWLQNVLGVQSTNQIEKQKNSLPELDTPISKKVRNVIENLGQERQWSMKLSIMVQGDKLEIVFRQFLVEDRGANGNPSYVDFLLQLHKEISKNC